MAINVKKIIAAFLELCEHKDLSKVTIGDIADKVELSRQAFYHHFKDKDDLVQYCYDNIIMPEWNEPGGIEYDAEYSSEWMIKFLESINKYKKFMKAACSENGPNCLSRHIRCKDAAESVEWWEEKKGEKLGKELIDIIEYHSMAYTYMLTEWILDDNPISEKAFVDKFMRIGVQSRNADMCAYKEDYIYGKIAGRIKN